MLAALHTVLWRTEWMPGIGDDEVAQLVERGAVDEPGGETLSWVVRDARCNDPVSGDLAACVDLHVRGWAAEIDARRHPRTRPRRRLRRRAARRCGATPRTGAGARTPCSRRSPTTGRGTGTPGVGFRVVGVAWEALRRARRPGVRDRRARHECPRRAAVRAVGLGQDAHRRAQRAARVPARRLLQGRRGPLPPASRPSSASPTGTTSRAWHADRAVDALVALCHDGTVEVPAYDIGLSRAVGIVDVRARRGAGGGGRGRVRRRDRRGVP